MSKSRKDEREWPYNLYEALCGAVSDEIIQKMPEDFIASLEYVLRTNLTQEQALLVRQRYEQRMPERKIAELYACTLGIARGKVRNALHELRCPRNYRILHYGIKGLHEKETEDAAKNGYLKGYQDGYQDCKAEMTRRSEAEQKRYEKIQRELPVAIREMYLPNRAYNSLRMAGIEKVEDLMNLTPLRLMSIEGVGKKTADDICRILQEKGFSLREDPPLVEYDGRL